MRKEEVKGLCPHGVTFAFVTPIQSTRIVGDLDASLYVDIENYVLIQNKVYLLNFYQWGC